MTPQAGQTLSHYRLVEKIGEGGMGVVWKAEDTVLSRIVAIKVLPADVSQDERRRSMFLKEAKAASSVSDARIVQVHEFGHDNDLDYIVMEYVEGKPLSEMLRGRALPIAEVAALGWQVAVGLAKAHRRGLLHRDIKPSNLLVTPDGDVKVADFGLASLFSRRESIVTGTVGGITTETLSEYDGGGVVGTLPYMSPEQVRGEKLDSRSDIFSFGSTLYEMTTGIRPFLGATAGDIARQIVLARPKPVHELTPEVPLELERCIHKALAERPAERYQTMDDLAVDLKRLGRDLESGSSPRYKDLQRATPSRVTRRMSPRSLAVALTLALVMAVSYALFGPGTRETTRDAVPLRASIVPAQGRIIVSPPLSAGSMVVFAARDSVQDLSPSLFLRRLDSFEDTPLEGTEGVRTYRISHDGRWVVFLAPASPGSSALRLYRTALSGLGAPLELADWGEGWAESIALRPDGSIIALTEDNSVARFTVGSGSPEILSKMTDFEWIQLANGLPDGRHVMGWTWSKKHAGGRYHVVLLDPETGSTRVIVENGMGAQWSPSGHLLFLRGNQLVAVPFDQESLQTMGQPVVLVDDVRSGRSLTQQYFHLSPEGTLAYIPVGEGFNQRRLVTLSSSGEIHPWSDDRRTFHAFPAVSPKGKRLAVVITNPDTGAWEIWGSEVDPPRLHPIVRGEGRDCSWPLWMPDEERLVYLCEDQEGAQRIYIRHLAQEEEQLVFSEDSAKVELILGDVSPDGGTLFIARSTGSRVDLLAVSLQGPPEARQARVLIASESIASVPKLSPDGRWLSYVYKGLGRPEVHVRELLTGGTLGPDIPLTPPGTNEVFWMKGIDGPNPRLGYVSAERRLMVAELVSTPQVKLSKPRELFSLAELRLTGGLRDLVGGRFVAVQKGKDEDEASEIRVILGWLTELERTASRN